MVIPLYNRYFFPIKKYILLFLIRLKTHAQLKSINLYKRVDNFYPVTIPAEQGGPIKVPPPLKNLINHDDLVQRASNRALIFLIIEKIKNFLNYKIKNFLDKSRKFQLVDRNCQQIQDH